MDDKTLSLYEQLAKRPVPDETLSGVSEASADHRASDANPTHREDFRRLVGAAARKPEPRD